MPARARPDECYRCDECELLFVDDQIAFEQHLASEHGRMRNTLSSVRGALK